MITLNQIAGEFLAQFGHLQPEALGPRTGADAASAHLPSPQQLRSLEQRLARASADSRLIVFVVVGVCVLLIAAATVLAFMFRTDAKLVGIVFGGASGSTLVFAVTILRQAWREKYQLDMVASIIPTLPPANAIEVLERIYFRTESTARTPGATRPRAPARAAAAAAVTK